MRRGILIGLVAGVLLTGTAATAASRWLITSTHQIKPSVLRHLRGERGKRGATGPAGAFSTANVTQVAGPVETMCASPGGSCQVNGSLATCAPGSVVIGGGWEGDVPSPNATVDDSWPIGSGSWDVVMTNLSSISASFHAVAVCASGSGAAARGSVNARAAADRALAVARGRTTP